jgi:CHAP domain
MAQLSVAQFCAVHNKQFIYDDGQYGPNPYGAQCVNVANAWCQNLGIEGFPGNAANFEFDSHPDCDWIPQAQGQVPLPGDIIVWKANGPYYKLPNGHVALKDDTAAGYNTFYSFDQNWPLGSPCHQQGHTYNDVAGWLRPRILHPPAPAPVPQEDEMGKILSVAGGGGNWWLTGFRYDWIGGAELQALIAAGVPVVPNYPVIDHQALLHFPGKNPDGTVRS